MSLFENTQQETTEAPAKSRKKNWTPKEYFIKEVDTGEIWKDGLISEKECRDFIKLNGEYDNEYRIGYRVEKKQPINKTARIIVK
jgi:hypothetical protein